MSLGNREVVAKATHTVLPDGERVYYETQYHLAMNPTLVAAMAKQPARVVDILSGLRGPDNTSYAGSRAKEKYTTPIRQWVWGDNDLGFMGMGTSNGIAPPRTPGEWQALAKEAQTDSRTTVAHNGPSSHYFWHAYRALLAICVLELDTVGEKPETKPNGSMVLP